MHCQEDPIIFQNVGTSAGTIRVTKRRSARGPISRKSFCSSGFPARSLPAIVAPPRMLSASGKKSGRRFPCSTCCAHRRAFGRFHATPTSRPRTVSIGRPTRSSSRPATPAELPSMRDAIRRDVAYALRGLRRAPAFTLIVVLTLGAGTRRRHDDLQRGERRAAAAAPVPRARPAGHDLERLRPGRAIPPRRLGHRFPRLPRARPRCSRVSRRRTGGSEVGASGCAHRRRRPRARRAHAHLRQPSSRCSA